jgi:tetratricopeptide (TPR) repeat protein
MCRMNEMEPENQNPAVSPQADNDILADTQPRRVRPAPAAEPEGAQEELAQTQAIPAAVDELPGGLENTLPPPPEPEMEAAATPAGLENTLPPPPESQVAEAPVAAQLEAAPLLTTAAPATPRPPKKNGKKKPRPFYRRKDLRWLIIPLLGLVGLFAIALISAFGGYSSGIGLRRAAESTQVAHSADQQFQLGLQDMDQGAYYRARQRFEYVIQLVPNYPGATEKLAEALLYLNATATPTLAPTPTITPTPDTRATEELFNKAQQAILNSEWDQAVEALLALRANDPAYHPVDIDGMLFLALRNRGRDRILKENNLEAGIYDLTLASNFGPLDSEAEGLQSWTQLYITGASFWGIDWAQAVEYFQQVAPQMPNLMDGSKMTATERLRQALFEYGNTLAQQGQFCKAMALYEQSYAIAPSDEVQIAYDQAAKGCDGGGAAQETPTGGGKKNKGTPAP